MAYSPAKKRSPIFLGVFFLVLMLVLYYIFAYIPQKEEDLQDRGIRVMDRMEKNIQSKQSHYEKTIIGYASDYIEREKRLSDTLADESLDPHIKTSTDTSGLIYFKKFQWEATTKKVTVVNANGDLECTECEDYFIGLKAENLLKDVKHFTFFDDIILVNQSTGKVIDSSNLNINRFNYAAGKKLSANIYDKDGNITGPAKVDVNAPISGVVISGQEISNKSYYCYTKEIYVGGNPYYLTGLISQDNYNSQVRSVSIWVVVITFIFMVFIIQVLPIVKPFLMNSKDRLRSTDLMWSGISLVFGLSALVLFTLSIDTFVLEEKDLVDDKLERYSNSILTKFEQERITVYNILRHYNEHRSDSDSLSSFQFKSDTTFLKNASNFIGDQKNHFSILEVNDHGEITHYYKYYKDGKLLKVSSDVDVKHR